MPLPSPCQGILHTYTKDLVAFEHAPCPSFSPSPNPTFAHPPKHTLIFLPGLTDGLLTVTYPTLLAHSLPPTWRVIELLTSSSYKGFGTGTLARDAAELAECVRYFRALRASDGEEGKVVLMGHSTGAQGVLEYLTSSSTGPLHPSINGIILQGGLSDREAVTSLLTARNQLASLTTLITHAQSLLDQNRGDEILNERQSVLSSLFGAPISAARTLSLLVPGGGDDYFSSDLDDAALGNTFGRIPGGTRVLILLGERDPYVPDWVDKAGLIERWWSFAERAGAVVDRVNGGVLPGGTHNMNGDEEKVRGELMKRVWAFLQGVEGQ